MKNEEIRFLNRFDISLSDRVQKNKRNMIICSIITLLIALDIASFNDGKLSIQGLNLLISKSHVLLCLKISLGYFLVTFIFNIYTETLKAHFNSIKLINNDGSTEPPKATSIPEVAAMYPGCVLSIGQYSRIKENYRGRIENEIKERVQEFNLAYKSEISRLFQGAFNQEISTAENEEARELLTYISKDFGNEILKIANAYALEVDKPSFRMSHLESNYLTPLKIRVNETLNRQNKKSEELFSSLANIELYIYPSFHIDEAIRNTLEDDIKLLSRFKASYWSLDLAQIVRLWLIDTILPITLTLAALLSTIAEKKISEMNISNTIFGFILVNIVLFFPVFLKYKVKPKIIS